MSPGSKLFDEHTEGQPQLPELTDRILVVEDDPSVQKILKRLSEAEGFAVQGQMDGRSGSQQFSCTGTFCGHSGFASARVIWKTSLQRDESRSTVDPHHYSYRLL
jgi:hypothetical protein